LQVINCEAFLLYFLAKNPRIQKLLHDEIVSVSSKKDLALTKENLEEMPYLKACVKESLRYRDHFENGITLSASLHLDSFVPHLKEKKSKSSY